VPDEYRHKIICDPVHGEIGLSEVERRLIDCPSFQRLRHLRQLGLASLVYPNATHSRFAHSLGVFRIVSQVIDLLVRKGQLTDDDRRKMRAAALLHDVGHYPYSHLMEYLDRDKYRPAYLSGAPGQAPPASFGPRYPDHEKIGQLVIGKREDVSSILSAAGMEPDEIAAVIRGEHPRPAYNRLIHSSLDLDRMDYMVRDSLGTGVPYGRIDLNYLLGNLDVTDAGDLVLSNKASTAAEHFLTARYFLYKTVYIHKTTFGFEALLRHILFLMRLRGGIYIHGKQVEDMVLTDDFLVFHDGYVDTRVQALAADKGAGVLGQLCKALKERNPPKLLHQVAVLQDRSQGAHAEFALFCHDRVGKIKALSEKFGIPAERWIWEDPKDLSFESVSPFVSLAEVADLKPEETAELIRIRSEDGSIRRLVDDPHSIIHHLSKLKLQMSRLYVVGPVGEGVVQQMRAEIGAWVRSG
jgi:HD superfamily phosphohydrolase